jgi:hypothetical protein
MSAWRRALQGISPNMVGFVLVAACAADPPDAVRVVSATITPPRTATATATAEASRPTPPAPSTRSGGPTDGRAFAAPPAAPTPQPIAPTFAAFSQATPCYREPRDTVPPVLHRAPGTVQEMEVLIQLPDGIWHRATGAECWSRTIPGPVRLFPTAQQAVCYAVAFRQPPPLVADCVTIGQAVLGGPGRQSSVTALAPPRATCTGSLLTAVAGALHTRELPPQTATEDGTVVWRWELSADVPLGMTRVTVTCAPGGTAAADAVHSTA